MVKASEAMIGLILISVIVGIFGMFMSEINTNYSPTTSYDNDTIAAYNQLDDIHTNVEELEESTNIQEKQGITDIIGGYFTDAYNALLIVKKSFNTFDSMRNQAIKDANLGQAGTLLRIAISSIVLILIVVGIILSAVVKRDL